MQVLIQETASEISPDTLTARLAGEPGLVLLQTALTGSPHGRYSFVAARPFLIFRSFGSRCEVLPVAADVSPRPFSHVVNAAHPPTDVGGYLQFGNPWRVLDELVGRFELLDEADLPFPLGGCFGFWGYDLKNFVEPKLRPRAPHDLELPDCQVGFYDSLVVFDHVLDKTWIISTGLNAEGSRCESRARQRLDFWQRHLGARQCPGLRQPYAAFPSACALGERQRIAALQNLASSEAALEEATMASNLSRADYLDRVRQAQRYIHAGDIYQVNLSQRLAAPLPGSSWEFFQRLNQASPAPFAAFVDCGDFQLASSSPELFLRMSGSHVTTRPIKGTRPRAADPNEDARLAYELQTSAKENAELLMITDLLRNDLGRVCDYGSVQVPDLMRLERYAQVQHLVSTVEGRLRREVTHLGALAACFPGGSITGAPKFRAMEIIDKLEPVTRGPFTGALGYLGFNRESQFSIIIRTAICKDGMAFFPVGAGIVADSQPEAEYEETLAKAAGFLAALTRTVRQPPSPGVEHSPSSLQQS